MVSTVPRLLSDGKRVPGTFENYFRMDPELFNLLLGLVTPYIEKQQTQLRAPISVESRLGATLEISCNWPHLLGASLPVLDR